MKQLVVAGCLILFFLTAEPIQAQSKSAGGKIIIGVPTTSMSMLPVFLAQDKGFFREEGIEPQLVYVGGRLQVPALAAGEVDYSASAETALRGGGPGAAA